MARTPRRWFQIRLTGLLLVMAVLAVVFAYYRRQMSDREALIARIRTGGGSVETESHLPDWLNRLVGRDGVESFERVVGITLTGAQIGTIRPEDLQRFPHLERVMLVDVHIGPTPEGTTIYADSLKFDAEEWRRVHGTYRREASLAPVEAH